MHMLTGVVGLIVGVDRKVDPGEGELGTRLWCSEEGLKMKLV